MARDALGDPVVDALIAVVGDSDRPGTAVRIAAMSQRRGSCAGAEQN